MPKEKNRSGDKEVNPQPLTDQQRAKWNHFLQYVYHQGYTGSEVLDDRNKTLGNTLLHSFNKSQGKDSLPAGIVPRVQHEFQYFSKNGVFPGYNPDELGAFTGILHSSLKNQKFSPVDDWFGSLTSQQAYPVITDNSGKNWGTNYGEFINAMKEKYGSVGVAGETETIK